MKKDKTQVVNLLKTARGQIDGIINMIEEERYCVDVSKQILSVQAILKKANLSNLKTHINTCVKEAFLEGDSDEKVQEIIDLIDIYIK